MKRKRPNGGNNNNNNNHNYNYSNNNNNNRNNGISNNNKRRKQTNNHAKKWIRPEKSQRRRSQVIRNFKNQAVKHKRRRAYYGSAKTSHARNILNINLSRSLGVRLPAYTKEITEPPSYVRGFCYGIRDVNGQYLMCNEDDEAKCESRLPLYHPGQLVKISNSEPLRFTHIYTDGSFYKHRNLSGFAIFWGIKHEMNVFGPVPTKGPLSSAKAEEYAIFSALLEIKCITMEEQRRERLAEEDPEDYKENHNRNKASTVSETNPLLRARKLEREEKISGELANARAQLDPDEEDEVIDLTGDADSDVEYKPAKVRPVKLTSRPIPKKKAGQLEEPLYCIHSDCSWALDDIRRWLERWSKPTCTVGWKSVPTPSTEHREILRVAAGSLWDLRSRGVCVILRHVKSHIGIPGNEIADIMAKEGSNTGVAYGPKPVVSRE